MRLRTFGCAFALTALTFAPSACNRDTRNNAPARQDVDRDGRDDRTERGISGTAGTADGTGDRLGNAVSDSALTAKIQSKYVADDLVKSHRIDVDTRDGVVTLKGSVDSKAEQDRAEMIARQTDGVKRVVNDLKIDADVKRDHDRIDNRPAGTSGSIGDKVDRGAEKAEGAAKKAGEVINDGWITTKIQSQYVADDVVKSRDINVDTNNGVVTLKGSVRSKLEHDKAIEIARRTDGVHRVNDRLRVDPNAK